MANKFLKNSKASSLFAITFFAIVYCFFYAARIQAATYYVDVTGGLDTNTGTSTDQAWQTIAKVNATTFNPGDYIYFKKGETWNEQLNIAQSGSSGNPITFGAYGTGNKPIIDGQNTRDYCITFGSRSYITINNIQVQNGKVRNIWSDGAASGITLDGIDSVGGAVGIWIRSKSSSTYNNITITGATGDYGLALSNSASNITLDNITVGGLTSGVGIAIYISAVTNLTASNLTVQSNAGYGIYIRPLTTIGTYNIMNLTIGGAGTGNGNFGLKLQDFNTAGTLTVSNVTSSYNVGNGIYLQSLSASGFSANISNVTSQYNNMAGIYIYGSSQITVTDGIFRNNLTSNGSGVYIGNSNNITIAGCQIHNNYYDGLTINDGSSAVTARRIISYNNGTVGQVGSGDGFTAHDACSDLTFENCIAYGNKNSGFAFITSASGVIYNSVAYNNGTIGFTRGGFWSQNTGGSWTIRNSIFKDNYPKEIHLTTASKSLVDADYNLYHHTADSNVASLDDGSTMISWDTYHTTNGYESNSIYSNPLLTDASSADFHLNSSSPAIDSGTDASTPSTDYVGVARYDNPFIANTGGGTNTYYDIGAYEFLGIHSGTTNTITLEGVISYSTYPSVITTAKALSIAPSTSSIDVVIDTWNTTSTYYKKWTESATTSNITTEHTIGDLRANQYYQVKVDDSAIETLQANSLGQITFTYSGGYSTKTFEVEEIPKPPTIGTPTILSSNSIRWNFTDNADNETGFRLYDSNGTLIKTVASANLSYIEETGLSPGTAYSRYIKAYNSYGESISSVVTSAQTGSAPVSSNPPAFPSPTPENPLGGFRMFINDNATSTNTRDVSLKFYATSEITKVAISENPHMSGSSFQSFQSILPWTLSQGNGLKTIYAILANQYGVKTPIIQDSITLIVSDQTQTTQQPETDGASDESQNQPTEPDPIPDTSLPIITFLKPINQMTQDEIASKMKEIQQAISQLQSLLSQIQPTANLIPSDFQFSTNLKSNLSLIDVKYLQILLNQDKDTQVAQTGAGSSGNETTFFGPKTTQAVIKFQEKYKDTILAPWNLTKGTGYVGKTTREKLNGLIGK